MNLPLALLYQHIEEGKITERQLQKAIEDLKRRGSPEAMTEREMKINFYKKKLGII